MKTPTAPLKLTYKCINTQEWTRGYYSFFRSRRLRDVVSKLSMEGVGRGGGVVAQAYLADRVARGIGLPEVCLGCDPNEAERSGVEGAVLKSLLEDCSSELFVEWLDVLGRWRF